MDVSAPTVPPPGAPDDLDVGQIAVDGGPVRRIERCNGERGSGFVVVAQRSAVEAIHAHGRSDTSVEVCGVLVGELRHDRAGPYLLITGHIAGDKATSKQTQVTFTVETWNLIQTEMETKHADKKVVGWYHTHPGFGVFLSGMDLFIQDNFFNLPWQIAWVYDPIGETDGVFVWRAGKSVKADFLIEENAGEAGHDFRSLLPDARRPSVVTARRSKWQRVAHVVLLTLVFLGSFAIIWYAMQYMAAQGFRVRLPIER